MGFLNYFVATKGMTALDFIAILLNSPNNRKNANKHMGQI